MQKHIPILLFLFQSFSVLASDKYPLLNEIAKKYQLANSARMDVTKKVFSVLTEDEKSYEGKLLVSKKNLRVDFEKPEKSLILVGEKEIWVVNYDNENKEKPRQVAHIITKKNKAHHLLLALLDGESLLRKFSVLKVDKKKEEFIYQLKPNEKIEEIEGLEITIDPKDKLIEKISYLDAIENKTEFMLHNVELNGKLAKGIFSFTPPKGVKVEEHRDDGK